MVDSLHYIFARLLLDHIPASVSALYVLAIGTIEVGSCSLASGSLKGSALELPNKTTWPFLLLAGTVDISSSRFMYYLALRRVTLSTHTLILTVSLNQPN